MANNIISVTLEIGTDFQRNQKCQDCNLLVAKQWT